MASRVPSLQATLPPSPQIFSVISDTSCHIPYLFFRNTNCVTPPQIIFANFRRCPPKLRFPKNFSFCSNCKTKRYFFNFFKLTIWLISCRYYFFLCKQKLTLFIPGFFGWCCGTGGVFHVHPVTPLSFKSDD